jgi:hypothetical protein
VSEWPRYRETIEEESYVRAKSLIDSDPKRFDELVGAAIFQIEADPESCPVVGSSAFRFARTHEQPGMPILRLWFTINPDGRCSLWWVDETPDPSASAEDV